CTFAASASSLSAALARRGCGVVATESTGGGSSPPAQRAPATPSTTAAHALRRVPPRAGRAIGARARCRAEAAEGGENGAMAERGAAIPTFVSVLSKGGGRLRGSAWGRGSASGARLRAVAR